MINKSLINQTNTKIELSDKQQKLMLLALIRYLQDCNSIVNYNEQGKKISNQNELLEFTSLLNNIDYQTFGVREWWNNFKKGWNDNSSPDNNASIWEKWGYHLHQQFWYL